MTHKHRIDVTENRCQSFRELIELLKKIGFDVHHFHAVEEVEKYDNLECVGEPTGRENEVFHLNLFWDEKGVVIEEALWNEGSEGNALDDDPKGFISLVADEWHDR